MSISRILHSTYKSNTNHIAKFLLLPLQTGFVVHMLRAGKVLLYCSRDGAAINSALIRICVHIFVNLIYRV